MGTSKSKTHASGRRALENGLEWSMHFPSRGLFNLYSSPTLVALRSFAKPSVSSGDVILVGYAQTATVGVVLLVGSIVHTIFV